MTNIKVDGMPVEFFQYPNGETGIKGESISHARNGRASIQLVYRSDADLIALMFVKRHLDERDAFDCGAYFTLEVQYLPYSRMDRAKTANDVFTLKYVTEFINWLGFDRVWITEPHSDVTPALLNNCSDFSVVTYRLPTVMKAIDFTNARDYILFPDAGAQKRYADAVPAGVRCLTGTKHRDFTTGQLTGEMMIQGFDEGSRRSEFQVLIVDDLCSRGGTFVMASKAVALLSIYMPRMYLFVAHCETTVYDGELFDWITGLYCTMSILNEVKNDKIMIVS